jgi:hypothetical protein
MMILLFSRPIEFPGIWALVISFFVFVFITIFSWVMWRSTDSSMDEKRYSSLKTYTVTGAIFSLLHIVFAIPLLAVFLDFYLTITKEKYISNSDETYHKFDQVLTVSWLLFTLICYFLLVKIYHQAMRKKITNPKGN